MLARLTDVLCLFVVSWSSTEALSTIKVISDGTADKPHCSYMSSCSWSEDDQLWCGSMLCSKAGLGEAKLISADDLCATSDRRFSNVIFVDMRDWGTEMSFVRSVVVTAACEVPPTSTTTTTSTSSVTNTSTSTSRTVPSSTWTSLKNTSSSTSGTTTSTSKMRRTSSSSSESSTTTSSSSSTGVATSSTTLTTPAPCLEKSSGERLASYGSLLILAIAAGIA
mmetsp:Transcript_42090/g.121597  ORF Transcript_42090/g.121597 Transcript_42090/m.121597 type:complete len:223 (+) Transcript_42090:108-776(+)